MGSVDDEIQEQDTNMCQILFEEEEEDDKETEGKDNVKKRGNNGYDGKGNEMRNECKREETYDADMMTMEALEKLLGEAYERIMHVEKSHEEDKQRLEKALEDIKSQEELDYNGDEEVVALCEKIETMEYQNVVNLERLEEYVMKEEQWKKRERKYKENEQRLNKKHQDIKRPEEKKNRDWNAEFNEMWKKKTEEEQRKHARHRKKNGK